MCYLHLILIFSYSLSRLLDSEINFKNKGVKHLLPVHISLAQLLHFFLLDTDQTCQSEGRYLRDQRTDMRG